MNQLVAYLYYIVISKSTFVFLHFFLAQKTEADRISVCHVIVLVLWSHVTSLHMKLN